MIGKGYIIGLVNDEASKIVSKLPGAVLDICCGKGDLLRLLKKARKKVIGLDIEERQITAAKVTGVPVIRGDALNLPLQNDTFNTVTCFNAIYNFPSLTKFEPAIDEMIRVVKSDGRIILDIRNKRNLFLRLKYWLHNKIASFPTIPYSPEELTAILNKAGFRIMQQSAVGIDNPFLAWGYILVFEKEDKTG